MPRLKNRTTAADVIRYWVKKRPAATVNGWKIAVGQSPDLKFWRVFVYKLKDDNRLHWHYPDPFPTKAKALAAGKKLARKTNQEKPRDTLMPSGRTRNIAWGPIIHYGIKYGVPIAAAVLKTREEEAAKKKKKKKKKKKAKKKNPNEFGNVSDNPPPFIKTRTLTRAPVKLDGADLAELGDALEIETTGTRITWRPGQNILSWDPRSRSLVITEGAKRAKSEPAPDNKTSRAFERWADRRARHVATLSIEPRGSWKSVGAIRRIDYASDKFGRKEQYTHDHGRGVRLYVRGSFTKPPRVWIIRGGRLNVTARGIVG